MGRLIDADALEREGWSLCRNYQQDKNTMVYETKSIAEIPTAQPEEKVLTEEDYAYCLECNHVEMCRWYPTYGCEFKDRPSAQPTQSNGSNTLNALDCISRQTAIDLVRDVCDAVMSGCESCYDPEIEDEVYKDIREVDAILKCNKEVRIALRNIPSAQPEQRWIPCSERLPKAFEHCLWTTTDGKVVYHYCDGQFSKYIAWMPLPEPYKEGEQDG